MVAQAGLLYSEALLTPALQQLGYAYYKDIGATAPDDHTTSGMVTLGTVLGCDCLGSCIQARA